ncbi:MAG: sel1 repeat family protein [Planctomycetes bacterium]|nr:sel1 repeat family protein [Planctomycetota bacterium]
MITITALCAVSPVSLRAQSYDATIKQGQALLAREMLHEAFLVASAAISMDNERWEGYALASLALAARGEKADAIAYVDKALERAPKDKAATLREVRAKLASPESVRSQQADSDARRKRDALTIIVDEADNAKSPESRIQLLREFITKSTGFTDADILITRAAVAIELDYPKLAWCIAQQLVLSGAHRSEDPKVRRVFAHLERRGWIEEMGTRDFSATSLDDIHKQALDGDLEALEWSAISHELGNEHIEKNLDLAVKWYERAAEHGSPISMNELGVMYLHGKNVAQDHARALKLFKTAAQCGYPRAMTNVLVMYRSGLALDLGAAEALQLGEGAARLGDAFAMMLVGLIYASAPDGLRDDARALEWLRKAADLGEVKALSRVGAFYKLGRGVPADPKIAFHWLLKAANAGDGDVYCIVADMYRTGEGVAVDLAEAKSWYAKAAANGSSQAAEELDKLKD